MAEIKYRESSVATTPTTTSVKGTPLTNLEMDGNMRSIQLDLASKLSSSALAAATATINDNVIAYAIVMG